MTTIFLIITLCVIRYTNAHGRLIEPPSRASAWRYGFSTPPNYNDHELYCGGFTTQWNKNNGKCGECGDNWSLPKPRPHEFGGKWGEGVIVRQYNPGSEMMIRIELTASHMGYFEFRICDNPQAEQDCLDKHLLKVLGGAPSASQPSDLETRFYPRNGSRIYEIRAELPQGFKCDHCVLQWRYIAGNNWGTCADGSGAVGCGPQEEFRACSDITIGEGKGTQQRPSRPSIKPKTTTVKPPKGDGEVTVEPAPSDNEVPSGPQYMGTFLALFSLFLVLCLFASFYVYHYHRSHFKLFMRWQHNKKVQNLSSPAKSSFPATATTTLPPPPSEQLPPVPPPRTRRNTSTFLNLDTSSSSILLNGDKNSDSSS